MAETLQVHGFETSNNFKVRVALGYKGLDYDWHPVDPGDCETVRALSGQVLTPVFVHGATVLFDSAAILRYLDANFPATPKLFGSGHAEQWEIEGWERFGRGELAAGMMKLVHHRVSGGGGDLEALKAEATADFAAAVRQLDQRLADRDWLVGAAMSAADVTCAPVVHRVRVAGILELPDDLRLVPGWAARVMAYDRLSA